MKYLIIYNETEIMSITPVAGAEILSTQNMIVSSLEEAKVMLDSLNINTDKIDDYKEESYETEE